MREFIQMAVDVKNSDYLLGEGDRLYGLKNYEEAIEFYRLSSAMGNMQATCNLGKCYLNGNGTKKDLELAVYYFEISLECIDSMYELGLMYEQGIYLRQSDDLAIHYYKKALNAIGYIDADVKYPHVYLAIGRTFLRRDDYTKQMGYMYLSIAQSGYLALMEEDESLDYKKELDEIEEIAGGRLFGPVGDAEEEDEQIDE